MTNSGPSAYRTTRWIRTLPAIVTVAAVVGLALCALAISVLANGVWREVDALAAANVDTTQWSLAQTEVELLTLHVAIHATEHAGQPDLAEIRKRFDILYSRIRMLSEGRQFADLRSNIEVADNLQEIGSVLDRHVPSIDGPDAELLIALPEIEANLNRLRAAVRDLSLLGVRLFASVSDTQRESLADLLARIGYLTLALVLALLSGIGILLGMFRRSIRAERAVGDARNRLQEVISTSFDAILAADIEGKLIEYNGAAERIFGYSRDEAIGGDMAELIIPDHLKKAHALGMQRYRETRKPHVLGTGLIRLAARRKDGTVFPVEMSLSSTVNRGKEIFVSYIRDISDRVSAEQELIEARDRAVQGENAKAQVLAVMSHEMRTPLNGILGTIELLEGSRLTAKQGRYLSAMKTSAGLLLHHVNGVLSISQAEAGRLDLVATEVEPATLLQELVESQRHVIESNGNKIVCDTALAPDRISVDPHRLRQVILNLVGNANKFTRQGEIRVECDVITDSQQVEFRVIDNGIGIAEDDIDHIFEEFRTLDFSYSRRAEGTGLGLAISRRLVQAMGGDIGVESDLGEGSLFWVRLPIGNPKSAESSGAGSETRAPTGNKAAVDALRILLVEDNEINRLVAREMLLKEGHTILEAHDGLEGVHLAKLQKFDVILMDISMPDLDGVAATGIIRSAEGPNQSTPIIALTAHALKEDTNRFLVAGITDILIKPLSAAALRQALTVTPKPPGNASETAEPDIASVHAQLTAHLGTDSAALLLKTFLAEAEQFVAQTTALSWESEPLTVRADATHKLAGSAAVLGAVQLRGCLQELEIAYRQHQHSVAQQHISDLQGIWNKTRNEILVCLKTATFNLQNVGPRD